MLVCQCIDPSSAQTASPTSLFQCQPSSDQSGQVYTPNIPDSYFNGANMTSAPIRGNTIIFTLPFASGQSHCRGSVVAIQYCYQPDGHEHLHIFSVLRRHGSTFEVQRYYEYNLPITPNPACTILEGTEVCCETTNFDRINQVQIDDAFNFTYGLYLGCCGYLLSIVNSAEFQFEHFQASFSRSRFTRSGNFSLRLSRRLANSIPLLRFFIGTKHCYEYACTYCVWWNLYHLPLGHVPMVSAPSPQTQQCCYSIRNKRTRVDRLVRAALLCKLG